jgi:hypothetical protein
MTSIQVLAANVLLLFVGFCGCDGASKYASTSLSSNQEGSWPVDYIRLQNAEITVHSGTSFECFGVPCVLLGVKDSDDPDKRKAAERFTQEWFKKHENQIAVLNDRNPLMKNQNCVCWVAGVFGTWPYLNHDLVRAGLVDLDLTDEGYTFEVVKKSDPDPLFHWQDVLLKAKKESQSGAR